MIKIRYGVFETNSSSTHAFTTLKDLKVYWFYEKDTKIPQVNKDEENNLIIEYSDKNINSDGIIKTFIGINNKFIYILFLLLSDIYYYNNYILEDNDPNKIWLEELNIKEIENLETIKPLFETVKKIGFNGININDYEIQIGIEETIWRESQDKFYNKDLFESIIYVRDTYDNIRKMIKKNKVQIKELYGLNGKIERFS